MNAIRTSAALLLLTFAAHGASAACVNRFVARSERPKQIVTLLTGKLTFQEAQALSDAINKKQAPPLEWVTEDNKSVAKQFGELKIVRPMPVGCDGKTSGVVMVATFGSSVAPAKKMFVKLDANTTVVFDEQAQ
jgi:hypothetical protein